MGKFGIVYDGPYSRIIKIKNEQHAEESEVLEFFDNFKIAKRVLTDYIKRDIEFLKSSLNHLKELTEDIKYEALKTKIYDNLRCKHFRP